MGSLLFGGPVVSSVTSITGAEGAVAVGGGGSCEGGGGVDRELLVVAAAGRSLPASLVCMLLALEAWL